MSEWQPIETAPKDGTTILAIGKLRMYLIHWVKGFWLNSEYVYEVPNDRYTHWMPLPNPPEIK